MALTRSGQLASMLWGQKPPRLTDMIQTTQATKPVAAQSDGSFNDWLSQLGITPDQIQPLPLIINPGDPNYDRARDMFNSTGGLNGITGTGNRLPQGLSPWMPSQPAPAQNTGPFDASGKRIRDWQPGDKVYGNYSKKNKK